jgi:pimeloyl-ACP methyl ester carboxylesterase
MKEFAVKSAALPGGETLAYREAGGGSKDVLLIHGNMSSSVHWQTTLAALEDEYHVVAPDLRGFGDSSYKAPFDSLRELAGDVQALLDQLGWESFDAVGWSTGGGVALELAAEQPERVKKIVLLDSVPPTGFPIFRKGPGGQPITGAVYTSKAQLALDPVQVLPALTAYRTGNRAIMRAIWDAAIYNLRQPPAADYDRYLDAIMKQRNLVDVDFALLKFNMTDEPTAAAPGSGRLARVKGPVLVVSGEKDLVVPLAWSERTAALLGDRAKLVTFPDSGHSVVTDEPEAFWSLLRDFLG